MSWTAEQINLNGQPKTYYSRPVDSSFKFETASASNVHKYHIAIGQRVHLSTTVLFNQEPTGQVYPVVAYYAGPDKPSITSRTYRKYATTGAALWYDTRTMTVARLSGSARSPRWAFDETYAVFPRLTVNARTGMYEKQYVTAEELVYLYDVSPCNGESKPVDPPVSFEELLRQMEEAD